MNNTMAIGFDADELCDRANALALEFDFTVDNDVLPRLCVRADKLVLLSDEFRPLFVDFSNQTWQKRRDAGKKQGLVRACKPNSGLRILDVTAGWGRDAAILASFGATVLMLERQPIMAALLRDALNRLALDSSQPLLLELLYTDARSYLQDLPVADYPDVIYIDPMHPERQKSALVKKDMQVLQHLFGADQDAHELIQLAITRARRRVVVKWPQRLPSLLEPDLAIPGKTVRFDIYTSMALPYPPP